MLAIPYVSIKRQDYHTEERAQEALEAMEAGDEAQKKYMRESGRISPDSLVKRGRHGSVVFTMRHAEIAAWEISELHRHEQQNEEAQELMLGRHKRPKHNGAEHDSGLLDGLDLFES